MYTPQEDNFDAHADVRDVDVHPPFLTGPIDSEVVDRCEAPNAESRAWMPQPESEGDLTAAPAPPPVWTRYIQSRLKQFGRR